MKIKRGRLEATRPVNIEYTVSVIKSFVHLQTKKHVKSVIFSNTTANFGETHHSCNEVELSVLECNKFKITQGGRDVCDLYYCFCEKCGTLFLFTQWY